MCWWGTPTFLVLPHLCVCIILLYLWPLHNLVPVSYFLLLILFQGFFIVVIMPLISFFLLSICFFVSLSLSVSLSLCVCLSLSLSLSVSLFLCFSLSLCPSVSVSVSLLFLFLRYTLLLVCFINQMKTVHLLWLFINFFRYFLLLLLLFLLSSKHTPSINSSLSFSRLLLFLASLLPPLSSYSGSCWYWWVCGWL